VQPKVCSAALTRWHAISRRPSLRPCAEGSFASILVDKAATQLNLSMPIALQALNLPLAVHSRGLPVPRTPPRVFGCVSGLLPRNTFLQKDLQYKLLLKEVTLDHVAN
jgi:hypothetical protein